MVVGKIRLVGGIMTLHVQGWVAYIGGGGGVGISYVFVYVLFPVFFSFPVFCFDTVISVIITLSY